MIKSTFDRFLPCGLLFALIFLLLFCTADEMADESLSREFESCLPFSRLSQSANTFRANLTWCFFKKKGVLK